MSRGIAMRSMLLNRLSMPETATAAGSGGEAGLGVLPTWDLADLYPSMESAELKADLDRMEAAGLIARSPDPQDGRGRLVALTDAGRATRHAMWPVYAGAIQAAVGERLSEAQARSLADLLGKLA